MYIGKAEWCCRLVDIAQHRPEERFLLRTVGAEPGLGYEIPERQGQRQTVGGAAQLCSHLGEDQLERGVVGHEMVEQQHEQPAILGWVMRDRGTDQRRLADIDAGMLEPAPEGGCRIALRQHHLRDRDSRLAPDDLHRLR